MVKFTSSEIRDIIISTLVIAGVFAYVISGRNLTYALNWIPLTLIAVGLGFVAHELAHKIAAIHYGFWAEYELSVQGLLFASILSVILGVVFILPGAVYIHGDHITREQNGKISIVGPVTNIIIALIFFGLMQLFPINSLIGIIGILGFMVNSLLALFNLIPFSVLDGAKIFRWNPIIWAITIAIAGIMTFYSKFGLF